MVASALSAGAETSTRLAPAVRCAAAFSLAVKMPVHSSAMSTPRSFHGSLVGSRSADTLILPLPRLMESPSTVTVPGKRPCTESKRSRWALVSTGPRSLMPTTSISRRPDSAMARRILRPMRPNPLIATRTAIFLSFHDGCRPGKTTTVALRGILRRTRPVRPGGSIEYAPLVDLFAANLNCPEPLRSLASEAFQSCVNSGLGGNPEMLVKVLVGCAGAEGMHADKFAIGANQGVPAPAHRRLDADLDRGVADHGPPPFGRLRQQQFERGHRDHP